MNIVVLGAGRVGGAIVRDLHTEPSYAITAVDLDPQALLGPESLGVETVVSDLSSPEHVAEAFRDADLVRFLRCRRTTTDWVKKLQTGTNHYGNVVDMALAGYVWDRLLDLEDDSDEDDDPDDVLWFE